LRLSTGVTLAANLDPVRVAEDYATVDAISNGRVEPCFGRGTLFPDVYTEFGQDEPLAKERFAESLELIHRLWTEEKVTWSGRFRPDLHGVTVHPRPTQQPRPPMWVGAGISIESVELAARLGCWLMLPTVFGTWEMFVPAVEHYKATWEKYGHDPRDRRIGAISHFCVDHTSQNAHRRFAPRYQLYFDQLMEWRAESAERAGATLLPFPREPYETMVSTIAICGSPSEVLDRFATARELLDLDTHLVMTDMGGMPDADIRATIDVFASDVMPALRAA
jgi:alkanesulfonate monooxygenase SsuD/methylene tetrahydromethanopterin reductase-like flavin-dependent oxidoreductase (luciferase family)